ncbi:hypothetical protein [Geodermatophilus sp. URMC 64]
MLGVDLRVRSCHPGNTTPAPTVFPGRRVTFTLVGKAATIMAKALFGHLVAPVELRVAEENAVLRSKVRRLEQEVAQLRAERDAHIASELLSLAGESAEPALA